MHDPAQSAMDRRIEPLSSNQLRMWLYCDLLPATPSFQGPVAVRLEGSAQPAALRAAVDLITDRHEILRTRFPQDGLQPMQLIEPRTRIPIPLVDLSSVPADQRDSALAAVLAQFSGRRFDFAAAPAWRVAIVRLGQTDHVLGVAMHHMIVDLWSIGLVIDELCAAYRDAAAGLPAALPPVALQQAALAARQRDALSPSRLGTRREWWRRHLAGVTPVPLVPEHLRPDAPSLMTHAHETRLAAQLSVDLRQLCRSAGVTVYSAALSVMTALVARWWRQTDFAVVSNTSGRLGRDAEKVIGTPVEYLILRVDAGSDPTFEEMFGRIGNAMLDAFDHLIPLDEMFSAIDPGRAARPSPLRQLGLSVQNVPRAAPSLPGVTLSPLPPAPPRTEAGISEGELWIELFDTGEGALGLRVQLDAQMFEPGSAAMTATAFTRVLTEVTRRPATRLSQVVVPDPPRHPVRSLSPAIRRVEPDSAVLDAVRAGAVRVLGKEPAADDNLFLLGADPADIVALAHLLSAQHAISLSALEIELSPTVAGIAALVARNASRG